MVGITISKTIPDWKKGWLFAGTAKTAAEAKNMAKYGYLRWSTKIVKTGGKEDKRPYTIYIKGRGTSR